MSIAASGDGLTSSEDEGAVGLPPSGCCRHHCTGPRADSHACQGSREYRAGGQQIAQSRTSRLDDWFLSAGHGSQPHSAPLPFFPEVHEELTNSWMAPFTAKSRSSVSSVSSVLTTLDGGAFPRWRERSRCTCAHETLPLGGTVRVQSL